MAQATGPITIGIMAQTTGPTTIGIMGASCLTVGIGILEHTVPTGPTFPPVADMVLKGLSPLNRYSGLRHNGSTIA